MKVNTLLLAYAVGKRAAVLVKGMSVVLLLVVLAIDILLPLGYVVGLLYLPVVLLAALPRERGWIRFVAATATGFVVLGFLLPIGQPSLIPLSLALFNRLAAIGAILLTATLLETFHQLLGLQERSARDLEERALMLDFAGRLGELGGWKVDWPSGEIHWSDQVCRLHGRPPGYAPTVEDGLCHYVAEDQPIIRQAFYACASRGIPFDLDLRLATTGGKVVWVRVVGEAVYEGNGTIRAIQGAIQSIESRKAGEDALSKALSRWHELAESMPLTIWTADEVGHVIFVSALISKFTGMPTEIIIQGGWLDLLHPGDAERARSLWNRSLRTKTTYEVELRIRGAEGIFRWHLARAVPVPAKSDGRIKWYGTLVDIHNQKLLEKEANSLAARLTTTLESVTDAFFLVDHRWRFVYVNRQAEQLLARSRDDLLGAVLWDAFPEAVGTSFESHYRTALHNGSPCRFEEFFTPLGKLFEVNAYPSEEGLAVYFRDVTEPRALAEQFKQVQRLESLGQLTGGVAHDFNNLLTVILGNAELLSEQLEGNGRLQRLAEMITGAAQRSAEMTQRLLAFARKQPLDPRPSDLNRLIHDIEPMLHRSLGEPVEMVLVCAANLWPTLVDPGQMESALVNLAVNARDAMPGGGRLTIETSNATLEADYTVQHPEVEPGPYVMVAVSDTGTGIPAAVLPKVFDPFFTTKEQGKGTGLGLATLYGFVKQSRGHVAIYSEEGHGTTVKMYLPRLQQVSEPAAEVAEPAQRWQGSGELVLVVEDDPMVRSYACSQLESLGYRVLAASNGEEGLEVLRQRRDVALLFTDVVMPGGMSGRALAQAAQALHPGLPVLYTSGYAENVIVHNGRLDPGVQLLSKPYRRIELARKVNEVIGVRLTEGPAAKE